MTVGNGSGQSDVDGVTRSTLNPTGADGICPSAIAASVCGQACYACRGAGGNALLGDATVPDYRHRSAGGKAPYEGSRGTPLAHYFTCKV